MHRLSSRPRAPLALILALAALVACGDEGGERTDARPGAVPDGTPGDVPDVVPDGTPDDAPDGLPGDAPGRPDERPPGEAPRTLGPLPFPPLTPPPDLDDEPVPAAAESSTAIGFALVEDRPLPEGALRADEDELPGPIPPPLVLAPPGIDLDGNRPPFFVDLGQPTVFAGERLEIDLVAVDPDGDIAGQYLGERPERIYYRDNFDTTRSLVWTPLEGDVGVHDIEVYAVDAQVPRLHVRDTVRVTVEMPADPSSIPNLPPAIDRVDPHPARLGDPIVIEVKGTDPNGTVPTLELLEGPPDATFVAHREERAIRVLRFVAARLGETEIRVLARDARDPSLTATTTIRVDVRPAGDFARPGARLRELAAERGFSIGFAAVSRFYYRPDGALYADIAGEEFDLLTTESALKWGAVNPLPGLYRWAAADNLLAYARSRGMRVHGHPLVWYTQLPEWIKTSEPALREGHMREHIDRLLGRYADRVGIWDVVNEALGDGGGFRDSIWLEAMGEDYVEIAFRQARASAPEATLLYNDYGIGVEGPKAEALFELLGTLLARDVPIDGVGFQMHLTSAFDAFDELRANLARVAALGLDVYVTELDVALERTHAEAEQARVFAGVLAACLEQPRCRGLRSWGFTDRHSWLGHLTPLMMDADYAAKPAYHALQRVLDGR